MKSDSLFVAGHSAVDSSTGGVTGKLRLEQFLRAATILVVAGIYGTVHSALRMASPAIPYTSPLRDALPFVQQALLLVWLIGGTWPLIWRLVFTAGVVVLVVRDTLLIAISDEVSSAEMVIRLFTFSDDSFSNVWSKIALVQATSLCAILFAARAMGWHLAIRPFEKPQRAQYSLRTILLFVTATGLALGLVQMAWRLSDRGDEFEVPNWLVAGGIGATFAVSMILVVHAFLSNRSQPMSLLLIAIVIPFLAAVTPYVCHRMEDWLQMEFLVLAYTVCAVATLFVLRLNGYRISRDPII